MTRILKDWGFKDELVSGDVRVRRAEVICIQTPSVFICVNLWTRSYLACDDHFVITPNMVDTYRKRCDMMDFVGNGVLFICHPPLSTSAHPLSPKEVGMSTRIGRSVSILVLVVVALGALLSNTNASAYPPR